MEIILIRKKAKASENIWNSLLFTLVLKYHLLQNFIFVALIKKIKIIFVKVSKTNLKSSIL